MNPGKAFVHALEYGPSDDTREIACEDSDFAYLYALEVDKCSRNDTRKASCKDSFFAYNYTKKIEGPHEDTRKAACKESETAYLYAEDVDKGFHEDTWEAVKNTEFEEKYKNNFIRIEKDKII